MTGPSVVLDPLTHAVRPDLADIRLAGQVFAPHFAAAVACRLTHPTELASSRDGGTSIARLEIGDRFDVLELSGDIAWGAAVRPGLVGYLDRHVLEADT